MKTQLQQAFGEVLSRVRLYRKLTPEHLSANSGVPLSRILRFENGMTEPTLSEVFLLSGALGTTAASLIDGVDFVASEILQIDRVPTLTETVAPM